MLTITRRHGEAIEIGEGIRIWILVPGFRGRIQVAIEAPRHVRIVRSELRLPPPHNGHSATPPSTTDR